MKILLINPNQYKHPPVPPVGLEYMAAELDAAGFQSEIADLCFSPDLLKELDQAVSAFSPDIAGVTVRNIDTVLYQENEFFLDEIKPIVQHLKTKYGLPIMIGGAGVSTDPEGVLDYLGADCAVAGPAEGIVVEAARGLASGTGGQRIWQRAYSYEISCPRKFSGVDYGRYTAEGAIAGFETHKGCGSSCIYCTEADTPVSYRKVPDILRDISALIDRGNMRFHLCDSEFNEDLDYCLEFLRALKASGVRINWTLYMKPSNHSRKLFQLMRETGVSLITLTVDSWKKCPLYWTDIEKIIFSARANGIRIVVDLLAGFPYEDESVLQFYLDFFRRLQPDSVGINTYIRLYRRLKITEIVSGDKALQRHILPPGGDPAMLRPVFYNHVRIERLQELIRNDSIFRIEGLEKTVNYCRDS